MRYFLGVDAGGTKTHALIADETGQAVGFGVGGPGNWESIGLDGLTATLKSSIGRALEMAAIHIDQIDAAGMGLAGYDWPDQREMILGAIKPVGLKCPVEIVNDATLGIFAGTTHGWGVSVGSGTGCNCRGWSKDRHTEGRMVGGAPQWSGEHAGGYDIVQRAMRAVTFEWGKRGPATALSPVFLQSTGAKDLNDLVEGTYVGKYHLHSSLVFKVFEVAKQGDPEALKVIEWAGDELGQMACGVIRQLGLENDPVEVVLIGSLFGGHSLMIESLRKTVLAVAPTAKIVRLSAPPVVGGVLLAMEQHLGSEAYTCRDTLLTSTEQLRKKV
jgi:N-acetylglucosamine kinase-like BadF-type ATPase